MKGSYKLVESIYCKNEEFAEAIFELFRSKGFTVMMSSTTIITGTHGERAVKKVDILE